MTTNITQKVEVTVSMSAFDMGRAFAEMHSEEQARFWGGVAAVVEDWDKPAAAFQWQFMRDDLERLPEALRVFQEIAEYGSDFESQ